MVHLQKLYPFVKGDSIQGVREMNDGHIWSLKIEHDILPVFGWQKFSYVK